MTKLPLHLLFWGLLLVVSSVQAQESSFPTREGIDAGKSKSYYTEEEDLRQNDPTEAATDTLYHSPSYNSPYQSAATTEHPEQDGTKKEDEDVLSFNFLYYIIQKFKMSDIVEK